MRKPSSRSAAPVERIVRKPAPAAAETLDEVMARRGLTQKDLLAAAKTYTPTGGRDAFIAFSSGGQSDQIMVYGIPSMRILKYVSVFTPEPWQGYGYDEESKAVLAQGAVDGRELNWGDAHHPAITETNGDLDGEYLFINDKSAPRIGVVSLHDFETRQIVVNPIMQSEHGGAFVTPNSEYVIEAAQYPGVLGRGYAPLSAFDEKFRGAVTYWKFNRDKGRLKPVMPTVFGDGKVAQFTTHPDPAIGFGLMVASSALLALAALIRRKQLRLAGPARAARM